MSVTSNTPQSTPATSARDIVATPNATADNAVVSGTVRIASMLLDNSLNVADSFFKIFSSSSVTVGTTVPDYVFKVPAAEKLRCNFTDDKPKLTTAMSFCCVTAGGTGGTTAPTSAFTATMTVHA